MRGSADQASGIVVRARGAVRHPPRAMRPMTDAVLARVSPRRYASGERRLDGRGKTPSELVELLRSGDGAAADGRGPSAGA